jgi:hypothetical protein
MLPALELRDQVCERRRLDAEHLVSVVAAEERDHFADLLIGPVSARALGAVAYPRAIRVRRAC